MSHFTVMVVTDTNTTEALKAALQPFHEYECTGVEDEYVVWVTDEDATIREEWATKTDDYWVKDGEVCKTYDERFYREFTEAEVEKHGPLSMMGCGCGNGRSWDSRDWGDGKGYRPKIKMTDEEIEAMGYENVDLPISDGHTYECIEDYAEEYYGYKMRDGKFGRYTNPNAKWDWWVVGGRWSGKLCLKNGERVDEAFKSSLDFETPRIEAEKEATFEWNRAAAVIAGRALEPFETYRENHDSIDEARKAYWAQEVLVDLNAQAWCDPFTDYKSYFVPREDYVRSSGNSAIATFAFLKDGKWSERGEMGWWAHVSNDQGDDWTGNFTELLDTVRDDQYIWVVDCHI